MKINEKTLISYASSSAPCDREGWLLKRGEVDQKLVLYIIFELRLPSSLSVMHYLQSRY